MDWTRCIGRTIGMKNKVIHYGLISLLLVGIYAVLTVFRSRFLYNRHPNEFGRTSNKLGPISGSKNGVFNKMNAKFKPLLTRKKKAELVDLLLQFIHRSEKLNVTAMLYGGTLLGSYRHHDLIPWDDDIDVFVPYSAYNVLMSHMTFKDYAVVSETVRLKFFNNATGQKAARGWPHKYPFLDVCFYHENRTHIWDVDTNWYANVYPKSTVFPLRRRPFAKHWFNAPKDALYMLRIAYGKADTCSTHTWNHVAGVRSEKVHNIACSTLRGEVPFVFRSEISRGVYLEKLVKGTRKLSELLVKDEPGRKFKNYSLADY